MFENQITFLRTKAILFLCQDNYVSFPWKIRVVHCSVPIVSSQMLSERNHSLVTIAEPLEQCIKLHPHSVKTWFLNKKHIQKMRLCLFFNSPMPKPKGGWVWKISHSIENWNFQFPNASWHVYCSRITISKEKENEYTEINYCLDFIHRDAKAS